MEDEDIDEAQMNEQELDEDDVEYDGAFKVPSEMYENLLEYQRTGKFTLL